MEYRSSGEEKISLLQAERDCSDFIKDLTKERSVINKKCETDIEELKQKLERLEVL